MLSDVTLIDLSIIYYLPALEKPWFGFRITGPKRGIVLEVQSIFFQDQNWVQSTKLKVHYSVMRITGPHLNEGKRKC